MTAIREWMVGHRWTAIYSATAAVAAIAAAVAQAAS